MGFGASRAHGLLLTGCTSATTTPRASTAAGRPAATRSASAAARCWNRASFVDNRGNGIWFDIGNEDCEVRNCLIADNEDAGIFYEISLRPARPRQRDRRQRLGRHARRLGRGQRHRAVQLARLRHRAQPAGRQQGRLQLPRADAHHAADRRPQGRALVWNHDQIIRNNVWPTTGTRRSGAGSTWTTGGTGPPPCRKPKRKRPAEPTRVTRRAIRPSAPQGSAGPDAGTLKLTMEHNFYAARPTKGFSTGARFGTGTNATRPGRRARA